MRRAAASMAALATALLLGALTLIGRGQQLTHTGGSYMGHRWYIDENRLVYWDGKPYIRYGFTGNGDVLAMMDLGFTQFHVYPDEEDFILRSDPEARRESVQSVAQTARELTERGATYYAGLNGFWPWQWSEGKIADEDLMTYVIRAVQPLEEHAGRPRLTIVSPPVEAMPALRAEGVGPDDVEVYLFDPALAIWQDVGDRVVEVDRREWLGERDDEGGGELFVFEVILDGRELPAAEESQLVALIRVKSTHTLDVGEGHLPALWRPNLIRYYQECLADMGQAYRQEGLRGMMYGDEIATGPFPLWAEYYPDFGQDALAMAEYHRWLERRFGTVDELNRLLGTDYGRLDEVPWRVVPVPVGELGFDEGIALDTAFGLFGSPQQMLALSDLQDEFRCWLYGHWLAEYGKMAKAAIGDVPVFITAPGVGGPAERYLQIEKWALIEGLDGLVRNHYGAVHRLGDVRPLPGAERIVPIETWSRRPFPLETVVALLEEAEERTGKTKAYWVNEFGYVGGDREFGDDMDLVDERDDFPDGWGGFGYEFRFESKDMLRDFLFMLVDYGARGMNRFLMSPRPDLPGPREEIQWMAELRDEVMARILSAPPVPPPVTEQDMLALGLIKGPANLAQTEEVVAEVVERDPRFAPLRRQMPALRIEAEFNREYQCWIAEFLLGDERVGFASVSDDTGQVLEWVVGEDQ